VAEIAQNASRYSLIVSDLQLPGVDGLGVLKAARAANPSAVVITSQGTPRWTRQSRPCASAPMTT
jgi:CheY-like chemotaxis protein